MTDFTGLLPTLISATRQLADGIMKSTPTFVVNANLDSEIYDTDTGYLPIEIKLKPGTRRAVLKAVKIPGCTLCRDEVYDGDCGGIGAIRSRPVIEEPCEEEIEEVYDVPAQDDQLPCPSIVVWVKPSEGKNKIEVTLKFKGLFRYRSRLVLLPWLATSVYLREEN